VTYLTLVTILQLPLLVPTESYEEAHRQTLQTGRPMVVMVGAEWCPACKAMEANVLPEMRNRGLLRRVAFALVDLDRDGEIGPKLTAGGPIPQLIVFRKTADGWKNRRLIGSQSIEAVEEFIGQDVAASEAEQKAAKKAASATQKAKPQATPAKDKSATPPARMASSPKPASK
jgi:thioredoxin-like negative regulator of GroEL